MATFSALKSERDTALQLQGRSANIDAQAEVPELNCSIDSASSAGSSSGSMIVEVASSSVEGTRHGMFDAAIFERILVIPRTKSLGFVLSTTLFDVEVWNTHTSEEKVLEDIAISGPGGMLISGGLSEGSSFGPLRSSIYTATIGTDGDSTIANVATFTFPGESGSDIRVTGSRLTVFSPEIDWTEGFEESIAYMTNVLTAFSGKEQRIQLRTIPRYSASFRVVTMSGRETAALDALVGSWQSRVFGVPWWMDASPLVASASSGTSTIQVDTTQRPGFTAGGLVMLWRDQFTWEALLIQAKSDSTITLGSVTTKNWNAGDLVVPMKRGRMADSVQISRETMTAATARASFDCEAT